MTAWADHGADGNGEPLALVLRAGNAGSNTAADHIEAAGLALAQLPRQLRRKVVVRADSGGGTHEFLTWLTARSRRLHYSIGMTITEDIQAAVLKVPAAAWTPAYDGDGEVRDGAWVADITGLLDLDGWPARMRIIVRKERPHPGAQLRFTDIDGHRFTAFATDARKGQLADLELRHRRRARCEDRIRCAKDTGLRNLPLHGFAQNQVWCEIVALACELLAWTQLIALAGDARRWEPKRPWLPAPVLRRGPDRPREPPPAPASRAELALGRGNHRRDCPAAGHPVRLTSRNSPYDRKGEHLGLWNPAHPARQPGSQARPNAGIQPLAGATARHLMSAKDRG